jgi:hypothetical protein
MSPIQLGSVTQHLASSPPRMSAISDLRWARDYPLFFSLHDLRCFLRDHAQLYEVKLHVIGKAKWETMLFQLT